MKAERLPSSRSISITEIPQFIDATTRIPIQGDAMIVHVSYEQDGVTDAKKWKTAKGAREAMANLTNKGTLIHGDEAVVCLYRKVVNEVRSLQIVTFEDDIKPESSE